ncbi:hypothetical protein BDZ89DRAFT_1067648 [Hymenopellis radicata]|nr:hypothetical protein BDZ89DRAFT_1067648 [Hymenopellis radicata]
MEDFPDLPLDVARLLLEAAAWSDRLSTARNLTLVSKDVRQWIDPILHHTVALDTPTKLYAFAAAVIAHKASRTTFVLCVRGVRMEAMERTSIVGCGGTRRCRKAAVCLSKCGGGRPTRKGRG